MVNHILTIKTDHRFDSKIKHLHLHVVRVRSDSVSVVLVTNHVSCASKSK